MSKTCSAKWNFTAIVFLAVSVMFSFLFVSCGDDDEDYGERKRFLDMDVDLSNFKQNSCKKEGDKYVVQFSIHGKIPGTFDELSNWGFDIKTKSGSYTNRYYAKTSDTYSPPTSKDFSCEVTLTKQDIEEYNNEHISTITITPFAMFWNQSPSMESFEPETYTLSLTETSCPDSNHPHWIDLGLLSGTQWRCCNEGASTPEAYGGYYTFGQVSSAPTIEQIKELLNNCSSVWTTQNGVNGRKFTGPNGGTIFLPAAGSRWSGGRVGSDGLCWSSSPLDEYLAYGLYFDSSGARRGFGDRGNGLSVRPVR